MQLLKHEFIIDEDTYQPLKILTIAVSTESILEYQAILGEKAANAAIGEMFIQMFKDSTKDRDLSIPLQHRKAPYV